MWIATLDGMFSMVVDSNTGDLLVRAHRREHMDAFCDWLAEECPEVEYTTAPWKITDADYQYRVVVPHEAVGRVFAKQIERISATNFKRQISDKKMSQSYLGAWIAFAELDERKDNFDPDRRLVSPDEFVITGGAEYEPYEGHSLLDSLDE